MSSNMTSSFCTDSSLRTEDDEVDVGKHDSKASVSSFSDETDSEEEEKVASVKSLHFIDEKGE